MTPQVSGLYRSAVKLIAYLRVSTDRQAEEGLGLDVQRAAIQAWARQSGHRVTLWTADEGVSGSNGLEAREGLLDALAGLRTGQGRGLVVYRLDRLARDLVVQETLLAELRRIGAEAFSTSPAESAYLGDDPDDPSRKLIRQILGAVAEYERAMIVLRLRSGRRRKAEGGGFAYGAPAFGFRASGGNLVPSDEEQETIERVLELRAAGLSLREVARTLDEHHISPRRAANWSPESVRRILARST